MSNSTQDPIHPTTQPSQNTKLMQGKVSNPYALCQLVLADNPKLRETVPVLLATELDSPTYALHIKGLIVQMDDILTTNHGIGIAAPQLGVSLPVILINTGNYRRAMINPHIIKHSSQTVMSKEGCLSFPGTQATIKRYKRVKVQWLDIHGKVKKANLSGLESRVAQHEIDHLNGVCIA